MNIPYEELPFELTPSAIEILGYSKNQIIEAKEMVNDLPAECELKLKQAFHLIAEVQEYLFNS